MLVILTFIAAIIIICCMFAVKKLTSSITQATKPSPTQAAKNESQSRKYTPQNANNPLLKLGISFLAFGVIGAILICVVSILLYGKIYFFDGYAFTGILWLICFIAIILGLLAVIICVPPSEKVANVIMYAIGAIILIVCLCLLVKCTGEVFGGGSSNDGSEWTVCHKCGGDGKYTNDLGFNVSCPRCDGVGYLPY